MSVTVIETLQNSQMNMETVGKMGAGKNPIFAIGMEQLNNAIEALENGKGADDVIQENLFGDVDTGAGEK